MQYFSQDAIYFTPLICYIEHVQREIIQPFVPLNDSSKKTTRKELFQMMKKHTFKLLSFCLCIGLITSTVSLAAGFGNIEPAEMSSTTAPSLPSPAEDTTVAATSIKETADIPAPPPDADIPTKGEGKNWFYLNITDLDGTLTKFCIKTDKTLLYDALTELDLITGEPFYYQLNITSVNGIPADWDSECSLWRFYINGKRTVLFIDDYAPKIISGATYSFEKEIFYYMEKGTGTHTFYLDVLTTNNTLKKCIIHTDKQTLGEALKEHSFIHALPVDGRWFITAVCGNHQSHWDLYINDVYACTDEDIYDAKIVSGTTYRFVGK